MFDYLYRQNETFTREQLLENTINTDIDYLMKNETYDYITFNKCKCGYYQLSLNGYDLWWGKLDEINAVVKALILLKNNERLHFADSLESFNKRWFFPWDINEDLEQ